MMQITVAWSPQAREVREVKLVLPQGATVADAIRASGFLKGLPPDRLEALVFGVWYRKTDTSQVLADCDRVEIYRPLAVDPKLARRERFKKQGAKKAGLFAQRRAGAKPGY